MLNPKIRYLQIALNDDLSSARSIISDLPKDERILLEAGTPFIKKEGMKGIETISILWRGQIVADMKTADGAVGEVLAASRAGATAITALGSAPEETLNLFIATCKKTGMDSMIDMLGVEDPIHVLRKLTSPPTVVILHTGRDEESTRGKTIQYRHVKRIRSKYDVMISAAGGMGIKQASSAIFNGANIVVVNVVSDGSGLTGMPDDQDIAELASEFLKTIS